MNTDKETENDVLAAAIARTEKLPDCKCSSSDPLNDMWEYQGTWLDEWGKNETEET